MHTIYRLVSAVMILILLIPIAAHATSSQVTSVKVGETVKLHASAAPPAFSGDSSMETLTEEERKKIENNQNTSQEINDIVTSYIPMIGVGEGGSMSAGDDGYTIIQGTAAGSGFLKDIVGAAGGYEGSNVGDGFGLQLPPLEALTAEDLAMLRDRIAAEGFGNVLGKSPYSGWGTGFARVVQCLEYWWGDIPWKQIQIDLAKLMTTMDPEDFAKLYTETRKNHYQEVNDKINEAIEDFWDKMTGTLSGEIVRPGIAGGENLIDFPTHEFRYEALQSYINLFDGHEALIDIVYIVEYKAESLARSAVKTETPCTWEASGQTHFWEITHLGCAGEENGLSAPLQFFSGPEPEYIFYYEGEYNTKATQAIEKLYCDALTYSRNEYIVLADTNQIIWKNEVKGSEINISGVPMDEQGLVNVIYNDDTDTKMHYITEEQRYYANDTMMIGGIYKYSSAWGDEYITERIE